MVSSGSGEVVLSTLQSEYPLGGLWRTPELVEVAVVVNGVVIYLVGVSCVQESGCGVTGSAGQLEEPPVARAYFELLERAAVVEAIQSPERKLAVLTEAGEPSGTRSSREIFPTSPEGSGWSYSRSNGVAVGQSWREACQAARRELAERDRVLRSWYGQTSPVWFELPEEAFDPRLRELYELESYSFPALRVANGCQVVGIFGFPRESRFPRFCGFGSRDTRASAVSAAVRECLQQLGFLWGEPIPGSLPELALTAEFHLDTYMHPSSQPRLRAWLSGEHTAMRCPSSMPPANKGPANPCVDLTPAQLRGKLWVAKALPSGELPLTFGRGNPELLSEAPEPLQIHPIA